MPAIWLYFDLCATFLFAFTGSLIAARRGYDTVGIIGLAFVSGAGGGLVRDGVFLQNGPPYVLRNPIYLQLIVAAALLVILFGKRVNNIRKFRPIIELVDALALGAYAVVGMNLATAAGVPVAGAVVVGVTNAIGGQAVRDVLMRDELNAFKPGVPYALGAVLGCLLYVLLAHILKLENLIAMLITVAAVFLFRVLAVSYQIKTKPIAGFESGSVEDPQWIEQESHTRKP